MGHRTVVVIENDLIHNTKLDPKRLGWELVDLILLGETNPGTPFFGGTVVGSFHHSDELLKDFEKATRAQQGR